MKSSHIFLIIANMYMAISFLAEGFTHLTLFILGCFWFICAIVFMFSESSIEKLEDRLEYHKFRIIADLLCLIAGVKPLSKHLKKKKARKK